MWTWRPLHFSSGPWIFVISVFFPETSMMASSWLCVLDTSCKYLSGNFGWESFSCKPCSISLYFLKLFCSDSFASAFSPLLWNVRSSLCPQASEPSQRGAGLWLCFHLSCSAQWLDSQPHGLQFYKSLFKFLTDVPSLCFLCLLVIHVLDSQNWTCNVLVFPLHSLFPFQVSLMSIFAWLYLPIFLSNY